MQLSCYYVGMLDACTEKLTAQSLRQTDTRRVLLEILHTATGPLAPPDIVTLCHRAGRKANKTTIYRDLAAMEQAGILQKVIVSDRKQYFELTERGHHHHFVCTKCEGIEDVAIDEQNLIAAVERIGRRLGFSVETHTFEFYGRCANCLAAI
jgi:Fur family ferric uptake transcriptional regulator